MHIKNKIFSTVAAALVLTLGSNIAMAATPDLVSPKGVLIGGAFNTGVGGKLVPWGGSVELTKADAVTMWEGKCAFNVIFDMVNQGNAATAVPFKNTMTANGVEVIIDNAIGAQPLAAGQSKKFIGVAYLPLGVSEFQLQLDSGNAVAESDETNNKPAIKVKVNGDCNPAPTPKAELSSPKGILLGGNSAGIGRKFVAWGGSITLKAEDAFLTSNGKCAFNVNYYVSNTGNAAAGVFLNRIYSGATVISQQTGLTLDKGKTIPISTQAYLAPGANVVTLRVDADNTVVESNEGNNSTQVNVNVDASCTPVASASSASGKK